MSPVLLRVGTLEEISMKIPTEEVESLRPAIIPWRCSLFQLLYEKDAEEGWKPVNDDISLKKLLQVSVDGQENNGVELSDIIPAGATAVDNTYALGAYLDKDADNEYQGKEYHVNFTVNAKQVDEGAKYADEA